MSEALPDPPLPRWIVPRRAAGSRSWTGVPAEALVLSDGGGAPEQATSVRVCCDDEALHVRFDCEDRHAWGTFRRRDEPLWQEEVVEVFLAAEEADPVSYFEFEVSPTGAVFDARIHNPTGLRRDLTADTAWNCPGLRWAAGWGDARQDWWAELSIPWAGLSLEGASVPRIWRANFYRVERPEGGEPTGAGTAEFSAWSPTLIRPADFHKPSRFGVLELGL